MAHKIWTGSINFGLVAIPVDLYAATEDHSISFHQYERGTTDRVRYRRVNERTGKEVEYKDIVKGREVDGTLVTVEPKELEEIAPGRSRTIDITTFVNLDEIDPVFFQKTYWLGPRSKETYRPYNLLRQAMDETNQVGIATFVLRGREYLTALRAEHNTLALNTMFFADEIRDPNTVLASDTAAAEASTQELRMATSLIESMTGPWEPEQYEDTYAARVEQLVADKAEGREPQPEAAPPEETDVIDLTEALRRSADEARRSRGGEDKTSAQGGTSTDDLSSLTKTELDKRAKDLDVRGRSKMNRSELERAIGQAAQAATSRAS